LLSQKQKFKIEKEKISLFFLTFLTNQTETSIKKKMAVKMIEQKTTTPVN